MTHLLPTIEQCLEFHDKFKMLDNIRAHSFMVARVAESLLAGLEKSEKTSAPLPDRQEVIVGALLHDIAKTPCLKTGCRHAEKGRQICIELGYPTIATIVAEHVVLKRFNHELYGRGIFTSKEMVFYADKRVRHDQIVSLDDRLAYILERYANNDPHREKLIYQNFAQAEDFEKYLFQYIDFPPTDIPRQLVQKIYSS